MIVYTIIQDSPLTNAGHGSCLTLQGSVECDASVMRGDGSCGIIGAVSGWSFFCLYVLCYNTPMRDYITFIITQGRGDYKCDISQMGVL